MVRARAGLRVRHAPGQPLGRVAVRPRRPAARSSSCWRPPPTPARSSSSSRSPRRPRSTHLEAARAFAADVSALGCGLALDDFGTGFGSFTYLRTLPLSYLKIDISFVRSLLDSDDDRRVVQSIIGIAERFGLRTIAEGVEDEATLDLLRELGADYAQGFHLGRPAPLEP